MLSNDEVSTVQEGINFEFLYGRNRLFSEIVKRRGCEKIWAGISNNSSFFFMTL